MWRSVRYRGGSPCSCTRESLWELQEDVYSGPASRWSLCIGLGWVVVRQSRAENCPSGSTDCLRSQLTCHCIRPFTVALLAGRRGVSPLPPGATGPLCRMVRRLLLGAGCAPSFGGIGKMTQHPGLGEGTAAGRLRSGQEGLGGRWELGVVTLGSCKLPAFWSSR